MEEPQPIKPDSRALADILTAERLRKKLSCKEVATELNLSESTIDALENSEPIENVSATYVRGYQRAYVRFLGLDESELLDDLVDHDRDEQLKQQLHYIDKPLNNNRKKSGLRIISPIILLLGLTALTVFSWPKISSLIISKDTGQPVEQTGEVAREIIISNNFDQQAIETQQVDELDEPIISSQNLDVETDPVVDSQIIESDDLPSDDPVLPVESINLQNDADLDINNTQSIIDLENSVESENLNQSSNEIETENAESLSLSEEDEQIVDVDDDVQTTSQIENDFDQVTKVIEISKEVEQPETQTAALANEELVASKIAELLNPENTTTVQVDTVDKIDDETDLSSVNEQETEARITFISNGESWLSITDAENNRLYRNTLKLDRVTVTGVPPIYVSTGNVQVLRVLSESGEQQKVNIYNDTKTVAKFFVDYESDGSLKFIPK